MEWPAHLPIVGGGGVTSGARGVSPTEILLASIVVMAAGLISMT